MREKYVVLGFACRPTRDLQEAANLVVETPAGSLRNVCSYGSCRATQLTCQSIEFLPRELTGRTVDVKRHLVSLLPDDQFFVVLQNSSPPLTAHCSSLIAQKLLTKFFPGICLIFPFNSSSNRAAKI